MTNGLGGRVKRGANEPQAVVPEPFCGLPRGSRQPSFSTEPASRQKRIKIIERNNRVYAKARAEVLAAYRDYEVNCAPMLARYEAAKKRAWATYTKALDEEITTLETRKNKIKLRRLSRQKG